MATWTPTSSTSMSPLEGPFISLAASVDAQIADRQIQTFKVADFTALAALSTTGLTAGDEASNAAAGCKLVWNGTTWVQASTATFATTAARDTEYAKASSVYLVTGYARCFITTGNLSQWWDGTTWGADGWQPYTPTFTGLTLGNGTLDAQWLQRGKYVEVEGSITFGSTTTIPGAGVSSSVPVPAIAKYAAAGVAFIAGQAAMLLNGGAFNLGVAEWLGSNTAVSFVVTTATGTYVNQSSLSSTIPFAWTTGAVLSWKFSYQAA